MLIFLYDKNYVIVIYLTKKKNIIKKTVPDFMCLWNKNLIFCVFIS